MSAPSPSTSAVIQEILVHNFNDECEECISQVAQILDLIREARKDELKEVNKWAMGAELSNASLHKWYLWYARHQAELEATQPNESKGGEDR